jgi:hypothetical protein
VAKRSRRGTRETGEEMREAERSVTAPPNLALLPDLAQSRVHAAYDPYAEYPLTVCGIHILPEIYLPGPSRYARAA